MKLRICALAVFALCAPALAARPNFIFVVTDDQRWDALGVVQKEQGDKGRFPWLKTPNMDRIANEGVRFRNSFVVNSLCSPSRACFVTSQYSHLNGVINNHTSMPESDITVEKVLHDAGYITGMFGKWHHGQQKDRPGFDYFASFIGQGKYEDCPLSINGKMTETKGWIDDVTTDYTIDFLKQHKDEPFFIFLGYKSPHDNRIPAARAAKLYEGESFRPVPNLHVTPPFRELEKSENKGDGSQHKSTPEKALDHFRCITSVDDSFGRLLGALDDLKLADNTMVVLASDNGYYFGEHGLGDKRSAYEESLRIVTMVRYPPLAKKGATVDQMVLNIDLAPTMLDLAGVTIPSEMQGKSYKPLLEGKTEGWRNSFFFEYFYETHFNTPTLTGVRTDTAKLIKYPGHDDWTEMFDLTADPFEMKNLFNDSAHADLRSKLEEEYAEQAKAVKFKMPENIDTPK